MSADSGQKRSSTGKRKRRAVPSGSGAQSIQEVAELLDVPVDVIARHVARGAPADAQGKLNVLYYAAWLIKQITPAESGEDSDG